MTSIITDDNLFSLVQSVWTSVLGLGLEHAGEHDGKIGETALTACVQITGVWEGAVTVACSSTLASTVAAAMFGMEPDDLSADEIRDAIGEVANMTGGNVKGVAPGENTLTLPTVSEGDQGSLSIAKTRQLNRIVGQCEGEPVVVTVFVKES